MSPIQRRRLPGYQALTMIVQSAAIGPDDRAEAEMSTTSATGDGVLLDELRALRLGLIVGFISEATLFRLASTLDGTPPADPTLRKVPLRSALELASLRRAQAADPTDARAVLERTRGDAEPCERPWTWRGQGFAP
ncbi:MAG: hypothetical protein ACREH6_11295 [Geminicoccaceae bacterium]